MVGSMERWKGKTAVVTGASSGIGRGIAEALVEEGLQVVALARREDRLKELAKKLEDKPGKLYPFRTDLTVEEDILKAFKWTETNIGPVHILVNCAGIFRMTSLADGEIEDWKAVLDTNVLALTITTREAVKSMRSNEIDGHIVHINGLAGHYVIPGTNIYAGSKFAVTALTESLRLELNTFGSKIKVTSISPGFVDTEIFEKINLQYMLEENKKAGRCLNTRDIADAVLYVLGTPPHVQIHQLTIKPVGELL